ncbi:MAG: hypothetical protein ACE3JK_17905 [Sporolactobacillus sp.]
MIDGKGQLNCFSGIRKCHHMLLNQKTWPSIGVQHGNIGDYVSSSSAVGTIKRPVDHKA